MHILFLLRIFLLDVHYVACEFFAYLFCWHMGLRLRYNRTHMALFLADKTLFRLSKNSKDVSAFERLERLHILQGILLGKYYAPLAHGEPFLPRSTLSLVQEKALRLWNQIRCRFIHSCSEHYLLCDLRQRMLWNLICKKRENTAYYTALLWCLELVFYNI